MNRSDPPRFSEMLDWLEGRLPPDEARSVAERLQAADAATQADLDWLRSFLQASRSVRLASPPPSVRETLMRRFAARAESRQPPGMFQRWAAVLTFDSRTHAATPGLRSATTDGLERQLIYTTGAAEIALNIQPRLPGPSFTVSGQVFPTAGVPANAFSFQLLRGEAEVALTTPDDLGEFTFQSLPAGEYELVVSAGQFEVVIAPLQLQA